MNNRNVNQIKILILISDTAIIRVRSHFFTRANESITEYLTKDEALYVIG